MKFAPVFLLATVLSVGNATAQQQQAALDPAM